MPDRLTDLTIMLGLLYTLEALLLATHALRHRVGLFPVCLVIAVLVHFLMLFNPLQAYVVGPGGLRLYLGSLIVFPAVLFGVTLVYITEGPRPMWVLVGCLLGVYGLVIAGAAFLHVCLNWPQLQMRVAPTADLVPLQVYECAKSAAALVIDVFVITRLFTLLTRRAPGWPVWSVVWAAFVAGLVTDGIVYPLLDFRPMAIMNNLPGQVMGKLAVSLLMSLPLILYLRQFSPRWLQEEIGGAGHFDLFQASGDLTRTLKMSERRFEQIVDQSLAAIIGFNRRGRVILFNRAAEEIFGLRADEATGRPVAEFLSDGSVEQLRDVNRVVAEVFEGKRFEAALRTSFERAGQTRHLVGNQYPLRGAQGEILFGVATMQDISRLVETEQALERANERLGHVVDSIREGMAVIDRDMTITLWNAAAARVTGLVPARVLGKTVREALPDFLGAPAPLSAIDRALRLGEGDTLEHIAGPGAGSRVYEVRLFPFSDGVTLFFSEIMLAR